MDDNEKEVYAHFIWAITLVVVFVATYMLLNALNANWTFKKCIETSTSPQVCLHARYTGLEEGR